MVESVSLLFIVTSLVLNITPGQDMMLVMSRSIAQGCKAGVITAAGVSTGLLGHSLLASLGLGALLNASEMISLCSCFPASCSISPPVRTPSTSLAAVQPRESGQVSSRRWAS